MNTKLTLSVDQELVSKAKEYARKQGQSLSSLIENYIKAVLDKDQLYLEKTDTPIADKLMGSFKTDKKINYKKDLSRILAEKYLNE